MADCDGCGFDFDRVGVEEIPSRTVAGVAAITALLDGDDDLVRRRPSDERWSVVEYGAHVRDVMLSIRDRLVIGLVEGDPAFKPLYREERIQLGLYRSDPPKEVARETEAAAAMFLRLFAEIDQASLGRTVQYGFPRPTTRTLGWMGKQVVHEVEHHLDDMQHNLGHTTR